MSLLEQVSRVSRLNNNIMFAVIVALVLLWGGWVVGDWVKERVSPTTRPGLGETKIASVLPEHREGTDRFKGDHPVFSWDGSRVAYQAGEIGHMVVVVNGQASPIYYDMDRVPRFSRNGKTLVYKACPAVRQCFVVVNDTPGTTYEYIGNVAVSDNGETVAYAASAGGKNFLVVNGKPVSTYAGYDPHISPDGRTVAYAARREGKDFIVVNEREGKAYSPGQATRVSGVPGGVHDITFSADGKTVAFVGFRDGKEYIVVNGEERWSADASTSYKLTELALSPDGSTVVYNRRDGTTSTVFVNGVERGPSDQPHFLPDGREIQLQGYDVASPDGRWLARTRNVGGKGDLDPRAPKYILEVMEVSTKKVRQLGESRWPTGHSLSFSDGSATIAFGMRQGDDFWWVEERL